MPNSEPIHHSSFISTGFSAYMGMGPVLGRASSTPPLPIPNFCTPKNGYFTSSEGVAAFVKGYNQGVFNPGLRGSGKIVRIRIRILSEKILRIRIRNGSDQFQKNSMGSHKIQIFSRADIAIASKLQYFGSLCGYKRNLPQNNQKFANFL